MKLMVLVVLCAGCTAPHAATKPNAGGTHPLTFTRQSWCTDTDRSVSIDGRTYRIGDWQTSYEVEVSPGTHTIEYFIRSQLAGRWMNKTITRQTTIELPCSHVWDTQKQLRHD